MTWQTLLANGEATSGKMPLVPHITDCIRKRPRLKENQPQASLGCDVIKSQSPIEKKEKVKELAPKQVLVAM